MSTTDFHDVHYPDEDVSQAPPEEPAVQNTPEAVQLSPDEMEDFAAAEAIIREGLVTFFEVGRSLQQIRANKWYRARGYSSFEAYCSDVWGMTRARAYQLIEAASAMASLILEHNKVSTSVDTFAVKLTEFAIRPLLAIEDTTQRYEAFDAALQTARGEGKAAPTNRHTTVAVQNVLGPTSSGALPAAPRDGAIAVVEQAPPSPPDAPPLRVATNNAPPPQRDVLPRASVKLFGPRYQYWGEYQFDGDLHKTPFDISGQMVDGELLFEIEMDGLDFSNRPKATLGKCQQWLEEAIATEELRRATLRRAA